VLDRGNTTGETSQLGSPLIAVPSAFKLCDPASMIRVGPKELHRLGSLELHPSVSACAQSQRVHRSERGCVLRLAGLGTIPVDVDYQRWNSGEIVNRGPRFYPLAAGPQLPFPARVGHWAVADMYLAFIGWKGRTRIGTIQHSGYRLRPVLGSALQGM
jgi:hypothetical protein